MYLFGPAHNSFSIFTHRTKAIDCGYSIYMKKHIPNLFTAMNLLSGCVAVLMAVHDQFIVASGFVFLGIFFDFFDGLLARKLNVQSELGVQLDSLADMVTSALVPGIVMYGLIDKALDGDNIFVMQDEWTQSMHWYGVAIQPVALIGFLITVASAYRLAKFNIDKEQQSYFKGLPTPANTILILSLPLILHFQYSITVSYLFTNVWFLIGVTLLSCYLLNSNIKLLALKFKTFAFKPNAVRYMFLIASIFILILLKFIGIPVIILLYILLSLFNQSTIS